MITVFNGTPSEVDEELRAAQEVFSLEAQGVTVTKRLVARQFTSHMKGDTLTLVVLFDEIQVG